MNLADDNYEEEYEEVAINACIAAFAPEEDA
jgi:hypothetical protein